jgi:hypothetical protein
MLFAVEQVFIGQFVDFLRAQTIGFMKTVQKVNGELVDDQDGGNPVLAIVSRALRN